MPRLFTGIEIPDEQREELARLRQPLPGSSRWIEPENLHLTLRFAGDIDNAQAREFADRLAGIDVDAFEVRLAGLGVFGGNEPRSLWAGVEAGPELEALARANERAARAAGLPPEAAHLQAARDGGAPEVRERRRRRAHPRPHRRLPLPAVSRSAASCCSPRGPRSAAGPTWWRRRFPLRGGEFADYQDVEGGW